MLMSYPAPLPVSSETELMETDAGLPNDFLHLLLPVSSETELMETIS